MIRLAAALLFLGLPALAGEYPALHSVTGVAADDVLNVREAPDAGAAIIGTLAPDATGIEVVAISDGWALVNTGEGSGYAALRYLAREPGPEWNRLERPLACFGTEPFWSLMLDPGKASAVLSTPEGGEEALLMGQTWPGEPWAPVAAVTLPEGTAVLSPGACSDGMSDRRYGIGAELFLTRPDRPRLSGCCTLVLP